MERRPLIVIGFLLSFLLFISCRDGDVSAVTSQIPLGMVETQPRNLASICISSDLQHMAYRLGADDKVAVVTDGVIGNQYDQARYIEFRAQGTLGYIARLGDESFVVMDGKEGTRYREVKSSWTFFSQEGKRFAYVARKENGWVVVTDGVESKTYEAVTPLAFSSKTDKLIYGARLDGKWSIMRDGERLYELDYQLDENSAISVSPDEKRMAWIAVAGDKRYMVVDGEAGAAYERLGYPVFSPDGGRFAYIAGERDARFVICDGVKGSDYEGFVGPPVFSAKGSHLGYGAMKNGKFLLVLDGTEGQESCDRIYPPAPVFSPDEMHFAYAGTESAGNDFVVRDDVFTPLSNQWAGGLAFSPNSRHLVYLVKQNDEVLIVSDESVLWKGRGEFLDGKLIFTDNHTFHTIIWRGTEAADQVKGTCLAIEVKIDDRSY